MRGFSDALGTIWTYENSIGRRENRVTKPGMGTVGLADKSLSDEWVDSYARHCADWLRFGNDVERVLDEYDPGNPEYWHDLVILRHDTPMFLQGLGFPDEPVAMEAGHIVSCVAEPDSDDVPHPHGLSLELMKRLPELLSSVGLAADDPGYGRERKLVACLAAVDGNLNPLVVSLESLDLGVLEVEVRFPGQNDVV